MIIVKIILYSTYIIINRNPKVLKNFLLTSISFNTLIIDVSIDTPNNLDWSIDNTWLGDIDVTEM